MNQSDPQSFIDSLSSKFNNIVNEFDTLKINVESSQWTETVSILKNDFGLTYFSWLSAIDWENEVSVGDPPKEPVNPHFEIICCLSESIEGNLVLVSTKIEKENASIDSLVSIFAGSNWHEREAYEMFGIDFLNHPNLTKIYLPDGYEGNPMLKSFELISREVKPWPGEVDVEGMPEDGKKEEGES